MKLDLQAQLFLRHPRFFRRRKSGANSSAGPIDSWGLEVGDGCYDLIDGLANQFEEYMAQLVVQGVDKQRLPRASQLKEKFGELRISDDNIKRLPPNLIDAIASTEAASLVTCECCGEPGVLRRGGYLVVECDRCHQAPDQRETFDVNAYLLQLREVLKARAT